MSQNNNPPAYSNPSRVSHHCSTDYFRFYRTEPTELQNVRNNINRETEQPDTVRHRPHKTNIETVPIKSVRHRPNKTNVESIIPDTQIRQRPNKTNVESTYINSKPALRKSAYESQIVETTERPCPSTARQRLTKTHESHVFDKGFEMSRHENDDMKSLQSDAKSSVKSQRIRHSRTQSDLTLTSQYLKANPAGYIKEHWREERGLKVNFKKKADPHVFHTDDIVTHKHALVAFGEFFKRNDTIGRGNKNKNVETNWFDHPEKVFLC